MNTGNYLTDYRVVVKDCPCCNFGAIRRGTTQTAKMVLKDLYDRGYLGGVDFSGRVGMMADLEICGETTCPNCGGSGRVEVWR